MALPAATIAITEPTIKQLGNRWTFDFTYTDNAGAPVDPAGGIWFVLQRVGSTTTTTYTEASPEVTRNGVGDYSIVEFIPDEAGVWRVATYTKDATPAMYSSADATFSVANLWVP